MKIDEVREKYPEYKISYIPKSDFEIGLTDRLLKVIGKDIYEETFISSKNRKYWILYIKNGFMTGSFNSKKEAVTWFRNGGR